ncbi:hypothetical protein SCA6_002748 [Theobroma cacao]
MAGSYPWYPLGILHCMESFQSKLHFLTNKAIPGLPERDDNQSMAIEISNIFARLGLNPSMVGFAANLHCMYKQMDRNR